MTFRLRGWYCRARPRTGERPGDGRNPRRGGGDFWRFEAGGSFLCGWCWPPWEFLLKGGTPVAQEQGAAMLDSPESATVTWLWTVNGWPWYLVFLIAAILVYAVTRWSLAETKGCWSR